MMSKDEARIKFQQSIYQFVNDNGLPTSTVEKKSFRAMLEFAILNAQKLSTKDCVMSNKAIIRKRLDSYNNFLQTVSSLCLNVRMAYKLICGKTIPFATICHDIWQGHRKDILGLCLMLIDPRNCVFYKIPVGLCETDGHTAAQVATHTLKILTTVGITQSDLSSSVNDNTNSAVLAGKYIVGNQTGGKCDMHRAELILKHATGLAIRRRGGRVIDQFPGFVDTYKKALKLASILMTKRKKRFQALRDYATKNHQVVVEIRMPNTTRVLGCALTFHDLLRDKYVMDDYNSQEFSVDKDFRENYLSKEDWQAIAEFEGILSPLKKCAMSLQADDPSSAAGSLLEIFGCHHGIKYHKDNGVSVLLVNPTELDTEFQRWDARLTIEKLRSKRKNIKFADLLPASRMLINRLLREFRTYMMNGDDVHAENAICGHPFLCYMAPYILKKIKIYDDYDVSRIQKQFVDDMVAKFSTPERLAMNGPAPMAETANEEVVDIEDDDSDDDDVFNIFRNHGENEDSTCVENNNLNTLDEQKKSFREQCNNEFMGFKDYCQRIIHSSWESLIREYPTVLFSEKSPKWTPQEKKKFRRACNDQDFNSVGKYFDVLQWWQANKSNFRMIFPSALVWLSKPSTNAFQERIFSFSSWFDSNRLMRNELKKHFEIRTMEMVTRKVRGEIEVNEMTLKKKSQHTTENEDEAQTRGKAEEQARSNATQRQISQQEQLQNQQRTASSQERDEAQAEIEAEVISVVDDDDDEDNNGTDYGSGEDNEEQNEAVEEHEQGTDEVSVWDSIAEGTTQGHMKRLKTILKGVKDMQKHHKAREQIELDEDEGNDGIVGSEYEYKCSDSNLDLVQKFDDVVLIDIVDEGDKEQMECMGRLGKDKDPFQSDSDACIIEAVKLQQMNLMAGSSISASSNRTMNPTTSTTDQGNSTSVLQFFLNRRDIDAR